jgi:hypothetical protein
VLSQVVLSAALPFPMIALVYFTGRADILGRFANRRATQIAAIGGTILVLTLNLFLIVESFTAERQRPPPAQALNGAHAHTNVFAAVPSPIIGPLSSVNGDARSCPEPDLDRWGNKQDSILDSGAEAFDNQEQIKRQHEDGSPYRRDLRRAARPRISARPVK